MNKDYFYLIALTQTPLVGSVLAKNLISYCGSIEGVFSSSKRALMKIPSIGDAIASSIINQKVFSVAEKELEFIEKNDIQVMSYLDDSYPQRLKHYHDCPIVMYYKGNELLNRDRIIAIVGTRKATVRGKLHCEELIENLKAYDVMIVSGLAYGIDIVAHKKSLDMDIPTLGVMANGLSRIYPYAHRATAAKMVEHGGLLTEYIHSTSPEREHFPMRNRIIAGMSDAVVVVESAVKGGSIITAKFANSYNKDVFAIPGRVNDTYSKGCNYLIKSHQAHMLESATDLAELLRWEETSKQKPQRSLFVDLSKKEQKIVDVLKTKDDMNFQELSHHANTSISEMLPTLLNLEIKGMVKSLPGNRYMLV